MIARHILHHLSDGTNRTNTIISTIISFLNKNKIGIFPIILPEITPVDLFAFCRAHTLPT